MRVAEALSTVLSRHTSTPDLTALTLGQKQEVCQSMNRVVGLIFREGPARRKRTTVTQRIGDSYEVTGLDLAPNAQVCGNPSAFRGDERYQTILIPGDPGYNAVLQEDTVQFPYLGTATSDACQLYVDTFPVFDFSVQRLSGRVSVRKEDGTEFDLDRNDRGTTDLQFGGQQFGGYPYYPTAPTLFRRRVTASYPSTYRVLEMGAAQNQGQDAIFLVRVDPIPTSRCTLILEVDQEPVTFQIPQLTDGLAVLPMSDSQANELAVPLLEEEALRWSFAKRDELTTRLVMRAASEVRGQLQRLNDLYAAPVMVIGAQPRH